MEVAEHLLTEVASAEPATGATAAERCSTQRALATAAERAGHMEVSLDGPRRGRQAGGR